MATELNISALTDYVNERKDELFVKSTLGSKTFDYLELMTGVKYKDALNYLDSEVVIQDGSDCDWNPNGADVFTQRYIEVKPLEVQKSWCWKEFRKKYMNYQLQWEAGRETLPFEEKIVQSNMSALKDAIEVMLWQGDSGLTVDGIIDIIEAESASTNNVEFESGATVTAKIDSIVAALPMAALRKGVNVFVSYTDFRNYIQEQNGACCQNKPVLDAASESINYFGDSRVKIVPVYGLEGTGAIVAFPKDAVVYGTDIDGADNRYELWYSKDNDEFRFYVLWMFGLALKFPDQVTMGK